ILRRDVQTADVFVNHRSRVQVIDGYVEEPLNLCGVQVQSKDAVGAGPGQQVGDQLGSNRHAAHVLAVLASITVIRQNGRDPGGAGPLEAVQHDEQLHQV